MMALTTVTAANLPALPSAGAPVTAADIERIEEGVAQQIATIDDVDMLEEFRAKAAALVAYLRGKHMSAPMLGAQRRVEARIGQLIGDAHVGNPHGKLISHAREIKTTDRGRFRILARGLERGLTDVEWRQSREALIQLIQKRYPMPRHLPTTITKKGKVRIPRNKRAAEIADLASTGHRAAQIAEKLGISVQRIRSIAKSAAIKLPDDTLGNMRKLQATRILSETINGIDAYVSGLSMLDSINLPELSNEEIVDLTQALSRSINGLRKLRIRMEKTYARSHAPAA